MLLTPVSAFLHELAVRVSVRPIIILAVFLGIGLLSVVSALLILEVLLWGSPGGVSLSSFGSVVGHFICFSNNLNKI